MYSQVAMQERHAIDRTFAALGDPSRRRIVAALSRQPRCSAGELGELVRSAQPTVSKHLKVLEKASLVARRVEGKHHYFSLKVERLREAEAWIARHRTLWETSLDRLGAFLDADGDPEGGA